MASETRTETTLADTPASTAQRWVAAATALGLLLAALIMGLNATKPGPQLPVFAAAFYPALAGIYLLTSLLIDAEAKWHSSIALVFLSNSFFFAFAAVIGYLLVFPGALTPHGFFGALPHSSFWLWIFWHLGVVALLIVYSIAAGRNRKSSATSFDLLRALLPLVMLLAAYVFIRLVCAPHLLPEIRSASPSTGYTLAFNLMRALLIFGDLAGLGSIIFLTRCRTLLDLWLAVVVWGQLLETLLGMGGQARYSYGWYFSRLHGGASALIILIVFLRFMLKLRDKVLTLNLALQQQASEDPLTGLANQRVFFDELRRAIARHKRNPTTLALLILDVDDFKGYNDTYGHPEGNLCLQKIGDYLRSSAGRPDDLVARIGGEEFAVLLPDTTIEGAQTVAANIIWKLQEGRLEHGGSDFGQVTISIGASVCNRTCQPSEKALFESADRALYKAKREGRNRVEFVRFNAECADDREIL